MDTSKWFNELEMEDYNFYQHCDTINSEVRAELEPPQTQNSASAAALVRGEALQQPCFSSESYSSSGLHHHSNALPNLTILTASGSSINETKISDHHQQPSKQQKLTNSWSSTMMTNHHQQQQQQINFSCNKMFSFHNSKSTTNHDLQAKKECDDFLCQPSTSLMMISNTDPCENTIYDPMGIKTKPFSTSSLTSRTPSHAQDHIMAERKRREKLSQKFIALSSILPGLKKMDKASVLGDAVKYVKHLEEKIKQLEEQSNKRSMESVVMVNRYELIEAEMNHQYCSNPDDHDDNNEEKKKKGRMNGSCLTLPEIEAKTSEREIMIRIHCEKQDGVVAKLMYQVESLNLSILNTTVLPFANSTLHITLIAQMDGEFPMTVKEVVKNLRLAFLKFM